MKVVHVSCVAPPEGGGIGLVANQEVLCLRKLGVETALVAPQTTDDRQQTTGDDGIIRLSSLRIGNVGCLIGLKKIVEDADVVHLHYPFYFTAGLLAYWRRQNKIKRLVVTLHMDATDTGWRWLAAELHRKFLQKRVLNSADLLIISTLDYARNSSFAPWVNDSRLCELPFGVDTDEFRPTSHVPRPTSPVTRVIGTVSVMDRAHPFKGIDVLLRALAKLPTDVHALLVGEGDRRVDYEKLAKDLGVAERAHFVGRLKQDQLIEALQSMDVFVFPSTTRAEAFGLVSLEAMACGIPVVASDLPGVREVIKGAGVTVKVGDHEAFAKAIAELLNNPDKRQILSKSAREKSLSLDWNKHAQKLYEYYKQICESQS